jgi:predicted GIY-YIG superfamily endonuclease
MAEKSCVVYWLYDGTCADPHRHGYVGISTRLTRRLEQHRRDKRKSKGSPGVPTVFECQVLFRGTVAECTAREKELRPDQGIGWNFARGGGQRWFGYKHTESECKRISERKKGKPRGPHRPESIALMSAAVKARYADPTVPRPIANFWRGKDRSGPNNPRFGVPVSAETRAKIGKANSKPKAILQI